MYPYGKILHETSQLKYVFLNYLVLFCVGNFFSVILFRKWSLSVEKEVFQSGLI